VDVTLRTTTTLAAVETSPASSPLFRSTPVTEWLRRTSFGEGSFGELVAIRDGIRFEMDNGAPELAPFDECVIVAADVADLSATDAAVADLASHFADLSATCSSMAAATAAGDSAALAAGRSEFESELDDLQPMFTAFEELMAFGDANEPDGPPETLSS
jgi:hypothetical protein